MVTTSLSDGSSRIISAVMGGPVPEHRMARTERAWVAKNWSTGSGDSHTLRSWNLFEKWSKKVLRIGGGFRIRT